MLLPEGKVLGFWVSQGHTPELNISIMHFEGCKKKEYEFYIILEPQSMAKTDSLGEYYGSFDLGYNGKQRFIHVFKKLYDEQYNC